MYIQPIVFSTRRGRNHDRPVIGGDKSDVADKAFIQNGIDSFMVVFAPLGQTSNLGVLCGWKRTHAPRVEPPASRVNHSAMARFPRQKPLFSQFPTAEHSAIIGRAPLLPAQNQTKLRREEQMSAKYIFVT